MTKKNKSKRKPLKPKGDLMAGMPKPKPISFHGPSVFLQQAREYPLMGCWIMADWKDSGLTPVIVARQQPEDQVIFGSFLVDIYCLGVKDAFWKSDIPLKQFNRNLSELCYGNPAQCEASLAHEIIYGSIEYARKYGFEPHRDFYRAGLILDPPEMHPRKHHVKYGKDGKPFFVAGPYDNARAIVNKLMQTAGEGNFNYLTMLPGPDDM
jgi:hypothetical protein